MKLTDEQFQGLLETVRNAIEDSMPARHEVLREIGKAVADSFPSGASILDAIYQGTLNAKGHQE